jgi:hypothetical protein
MSNNLGWPLEHAHTREAIEQRLAQEASGNYLRDWVYGGFDGTIMTFAIVAGVVAWPGLSRLRPEFALGQGASGHDMAGWLIIVYSVAILCVCPTGAKQGSVADWEFQESDAADGNHRYSTL